MKDQTENLPKSIKSALEKRREKDSLRKLVDNESLIDFASNDYLGLAANERLQELIKEEFNRKNLNVGGTGSRLISGNSKLYTNLEEKLSGIFRSEATLLFNSGYNANQGLISSLGGKGDTIIYDKLSHVCIKEGAWLSKAQSFSFNHNDLIDLEKKILQSTGDVFVITESVFSMDGDTAPLFEIVEICKKYRCYLIVDEAHSTGVYGERGEGLICVNDLEGDLFARVYTFGKGMGVHGACVAGSEKLIQYLINFSRPFIYTTSLPPHSIVSINSSFDFLAENNHLQGYLKKNIENFENSIGPKITLSSQTAIQPIMISGNTQCKQVAESLQKEGLDVRAILAPTVKQGTERLRISIHANHTREQIKMLSDTLFNELI